MAHSVDKFFSYYLMEITRLRDLLTEKCARIVNEVRQISSANNFGLFRSWSSFVYIACASLSFLTL